MTPEQQRIALAEWAGWKKLRDGRYKKDEIVERFLPDYLNDLNAVHDLLKPERFTPPGNPSKTRFWLELVFVCGSTESTAFATAAQRCEALLRTLNLWEP